MVVASLSAALWTADMRREGSAGHAQHVWQRRLGERPRHASQPDAAMTPVHHSAQPEERVAESPIANAVTAQVRAAAAQRQLATTSNSLPCAGC